MHWALMLAVLLSGCGVVQAVKDVKDKVKGLTNPMVGQGLIVGAEEPQDPDLAPLLEAAAFEPGTSVTLFLADSASAAGADDAPVTGARVTLHASVVAPVIEAGEGFYALGPDSAPPYADGAFWDLAVDYAGEASGLAVELPPAAAVQVPGQHVALADLVLDFTGQRYQSALIFVVDGSGTVTWTNEPQTAAEAIDFAGGDDDMEILVVPGVEAFPLESFYAVGIAGLRSTEPGGIENMNTVLSNLQAGKLRWYPVSTAPIPAP